MSPKPAGPNHKCRRARASLRAKRSSPAKLVAGVRRSATASKIARPMRHDAKQRTRIGIVDQCQLGLIRIERRALLRATGNRFSMQRHLRADRSVAGSTAGVNIQHGVKAAFGDIAMKIQPLARRANAIG